MASLSKEHKTFIVTALAQFQSPTEVVEAVKTEFEGFVVTRQQVRHYNPLQNKKLAKDWKKLFTTERKRFLDDVSAIPIANQAVRVARLDEMERAARRMKNYPLAASLNEQAAKEVGGVFTNRREVTGKNGGALMEVVVTPQLIDYRDASAALKPPDADHPPDTVDLPSGSHSSAGNGEAG